MNTANTNIITIECDEQAWSIRYNLTEALRAASTTDESRQAFIDTLSDDEFYVLFG